MAKGSRSGDSGAAVIGTGSQGWLAGLPAGWAEAAVRRFLFFFPPRLSEAAGLQEGVGYHCHERVAMETSPGTAFEVVKAKLFLELLMRLLADPARLDGAGQFLDRRVRRQVREIVFPLTARNDARLPARLPRRACVALPRNLCAAAREREKGGGKNLQVIEAFSGKGTRGWHN